MDLNTERELLVKLQTNYETLISVCESWIAKGCATQWWLDKKKQCEDAAADVRIKLSFLQETQGLPPAVQAMNSMLSSIFADLNY